MITLIDEFDRDRDLTTESGEPASVGSWLEVRCEFPLGGQPQAPLIPWGPIAGAFESWRCADYYDLAFFVRKPPGLRLRFQLKHSPDEFRGIVTAWVEGLEQAHKVNKHTLSIYEPEEYRFGGPEGMGVAHRLWSLDTELVLRYELLKPSQRSSVSRTALWAMAEHHFLKSTLDDDAEIWDVWRRLADACSNLPAHGPTKESYERMAPSLIDPRATVLAVLTPQSRSILAGCEKANVESASAIRRLRDEGDLTRGLRSWLTADALFHINRWAVGLEAAQLRALTEAMVQLLEPDRSHGPALYGITSKLAEPRAHYRTSTHIRYRGRGQFPLMNRKRRRNFV
jgi:thiopeptide-type bacteriocin biosynthesis protein